MQICYINHSKLLHRIGWKYCESDGHINHTSYHKQRDPPVTDSMATLGSLLNPGLIPESQKQAVTGSICLGEGLPPVPAKLVERIGKGEFIEMHELLPDLWLQAVDRETNSRSGRRRRVMDIKIWAQCFASYIRVMAETEPERVADRLGYMINIIRASGDFEGSAWVTYDDTFRRQAANNKDMKWSNINSSLFSLCFTNQDRAGKRCGFCFRSYLANGHHQCPLQEEGEMRQQQQNTEGIDGEINQGASTTWPRCRRFNEGRCHLMDCSFRHVCTRCGGRHPAVACRQGPSKGAPSNQSKQKGGFRQWPY